jgi:phage tail-like protein
VIYSVGGEKGVEAKIKNDQVKRQSRYLEYLPAFFRDGKDVTPALKDKGASLVGVGEFLLIFEDILQPIENGIDNMPLYFDPLMTPEPLLFWLSSWLGLVLDGKLPVERRRRLVKLASELYRWRGTRRGLSEYLRIYTGSTPEIREHVTGMRLDRNTRLGVNSQLGGSGQGFHFNVAVPAPPEGELNIGAIKAIIEAQKPAYTTYSLQVIPART